MKIVARKGDSIFLIDVGEGDGVVADIDEGVRFPKFNIQAILARGYWQDANHDESLMQQLLELPEGESDVAE